MPRKIQLTWQPGADGRSGRWRKKYKGRTLYLGMASAKSDVAAYRAAFKKWEEEQARIDAEEAAKPKPHQADYESAIAEWEGVLAWASESGDENTAHIARGKLRDLRARLDQKSPPPIELRDRLTSLYSHIPEGPCLFDFNAAETSGMTDVPCPAESDAGRPTFEREARDQAVNAARWEERLATQAVRFDSGEQTLGEHLDLYLEAERARIGTDNFTAGRYTSKKTNVTAFVEWLGRGAAVEALTGERLFEYRRHLLGCVSDERLARATASDRLNDAVAFVRSLYNREILDALPRVLVGGGGSALSIDRGVSEPVFFTTGEVKRCLDSASERLKLYLLLMINCGMYQGDISDLHPNEVDWTAGTITRKRSKTRRHGSVPTVRHKLWPVTFRLLHKYRSADAERVLLNTRGNPLVDRSLREDGGARTNDAVKSAYDRLRKQVGITGKSLKHLRKTSSNLIAGHERFRGLEDLFLGHSPRSMAERHYTAPPLDLLAEATDWLAIQYGVVEA